MIDGRPLSGNSLPLDEFTFGRRPRSRNDGHQCHRPRQEADAMTDEAPTDESAEDDVQGVDVPDLDAPAAAQEDVAGGMTKQEFVDRVASDTGLNKRDAGSSV
jgi:hypothetical protein